MIRVRATRTPHRRSQFFRVFVLLWVPFIPDVLFVLTLGEIGLIISLLLYLIGSVLAAKMLLNDYRHSPRGSEKDRNRRVLFGVDVIAAATAMLGLFIGAASGRYGQIYKQVGLSIIGIACALWAASLVWAIVHYSDTRDRLLLIVALSFTWISLIGAIQLLLQPASFWSLQK